MYIEKYGALVKVIPGTLCLNRKYVVVKLTFSRSSLKDPKSDKRLGTYSGQHFLLVMNLGSENCEYGKLEPFKVMNIIKLNSIKGFLDFFLHEKTWALPTMLFSFDERQILQQS